MPELFGHTRARVAARHALLTPANHVGSVLPGITGAAVVVLASEAMGARFAQLLVTFRAGGRVAPPLGDTETFGYFMGGSAVLTIGAKRQRCRTGHYFYIPPRQAWTLSEPKAGAQLTLFQKKYAPLGGVSAPRPLVGDARRIPGQPCLGDPAVRRQILLPDELGFDLAVNLFTYQPGAHLPLVDVHVAEHGLIMLAGQGVCRLEEAWYPVRAGDSVWMAPYCAQWFVAMGPAPAAYLCYRDANRAAL